MKTVWLALTHVEVSFQEAGNVPDHDTRRISFLRSAIATARLHLDCARLAG